MVKRIKVEQISPKYSLNKRDGLKILKGSGIAIGSALVIYLAEIIPNTDFGKLSYIIIPIAGIIINALRKYLSGK